MNLSRRPSYPSSRSYVLKLHSEARPAHGRVRGLLENVSTGDRCEFHNAAELLGCLAQDDHDIPNPTE